MNIEIHRADPQLQRRTMVIVSAAIVAALLLMVLFHHWLDRAMLAMPGERFVLEMRRMIGMTCTACGLCMLLLAGYAARLGRRVVEQRRWPLRASRVVLDTRVRHGDDAVRFARMLNMFALVLIVLAFGAGVLGWQLF